MLIKGSFTDKKNKEYLYNIEGINYFEKKALILEENNNLISACIIPVIHTVDRIPKSYSFNINNKKYIFKNAIKTSLTGEGIFLIVKNLSYLYVNNLMHSGLIINGKSTVVVNNLVICSIFQSKEAKLLYNRTYGKCKFNKKPNLSTLRF